MEKAIVITSLLILRSFKKSEKCCTFAVIIIHWRTTTCTIARSGKLRNVLQECFKSNPSNRVFIVQLIVQPAISGYCIAHGGFSTQSGEKQLFMRQWEPWRYKVQWLQILFIYCTMKDSKSPSRSATSSSNV